MSVEELNAHNLIQRNEDGTIKSIRFMISDSMVFEGTVTEYLNLIYPMFV